MVHSQDRESYYCLKLKNWNDPCPVRCPYLQPGKPGSLEEIENERYILDCIQFTRQKRANDEEKFWCKVYYTNKPPCHSESGQPCPWAH